MAGLERATAHVALTTDVHARVSSWNDGCCALFGLSAQQALGSSMDNLIAESSGELLKTCLSELPNQCDARSVHVIHAVNGPQEASMVLVPCFDHSGRHASTIALFNAEPADSETARVGRMPLRSVIDVLPGTFYVVREDGSMVLWNRTLEQVTGMSADELAQANAVDMYDLVEKRIIAARIRDVFTHQRQVFVEAHYRDKQGHGTPYLLCGALIDCHGRQYLCGMGLDISERRQQEERLRLRDRALHASSSALVITRCSEEEHLVEYANPAFERITGYTAAEVMGRDMRFLAAPGLDEPQRDSLRAALRDQREVKVVFRNRRKDGELFWNELTITPVDNGHGKVTHFIGVLNDVTATQQRTAMLEHEVNHDALTGLANRTLLWDRLEHAIHMAQRNKTLVATVMVDLNGFKQINDTFGHEAGDHVLTVVARRLQSSVREVDTVARLSGDEFVLVLVDQPSLRYTLRMIERLRSSMGERVPIDGVATEVSASMGVSVYPHDGSTCMELMRAADTAMYHAKAGGKGDVHFFSTDMRSTTQAREKLEKDMALALERDELFLLFQPKVCLRSGRISGFEAFLRWRHPEFGVMLPSAFLAEAEENGMIVHFGDEVLNKVCAFMQRLQEAGMPVLPMAVNVSFREFSRPRYAQHVADTVSACDLAAGHLELELREDCLYRNRHLSIEVLSQLRDSGVQRSIDAFGNGPSDLHFLQKLPISHMKIARAAVHQISSDSNKGMVARALIDVGHDLGVGVIAKGVETREQMDFLKRYECDELQGSYFSEPLSEPALFELLMASAPG